MTKLVYIMDPLCGWCYGNSRNILQTFETYKNTLPFEILPGGMWAGENVRRQSKQMAAYFKKHDQQIAALTGTTFGDAYFQLIEDEQMILDSEIPSRAMITVQQLWPEKTVPFAVAVQKARYFEGKDLNDEQTYRDICEALHIPAAAFTAAFHSPAMKEATRLAFEKAAGYAMSYPSLLLDKGTETILIEQGYSDFESINNRIAYVTAVK